MSKLYRCNVVALQWFLATNDYKLHAILDGGADNVLGQIHTKVEVLLPTIGTRASVDSNVRWLNT